MFKTFSTGVLLGILLAGVAAWLVPLNNLHREPSRITVLPNGANAEVFRINIPTDRIVSGSGDGRLEAVPESIIWPAAPELVDAAVELFKIRNFDNQVVGLASRLQAAGTAGTEVVEWVVHLPARGTMYAIMEPGEPGAEGRNGSLRTGTGEFADRSGTLQESYAGGTADDADGTAGRIELKAQLVSAALVAPEGVAL